MIAAGVGLMAAGVLIPSLINDRNCPDGGPTYKAALPGGVVMGFGGLALTAVGIYRLRRQSFVERRFKRGDAAGFVFTSLGTAAVGSGLLALISASEVMGCISD
jgi:membrane protease YdiL (CAAX protease family)